MLDIDTSDPGPKKGNARELARPHRANRRLVLAALVGPTIAILVGYLLFGRQVPGVDPRLLNPAFPEPAGQAVADDADQRARIILEAREREEVDNEEAADSRLRLAAKRLSHSWTVIDSAELSKGKRFVFLVQHPSSGNMYSVFVDEDRVVEHATEDHFFWETATPNRLAEMWAARKLGGSFRTKQASIASLSLTATVINQATARLYLLEMKGFDPADNQAVVSLISIDE